MKNKDPKRPLRHGQFNEDQTKRFWQYHPSGKEGWVTPERFEEAVLARKMKS